MIRSMLSESLRAVISQTLLKKVGASCRSWIMIATSAIKNLIREDKIAQMYSSIQTGAAHGMQTLDQSLQNLLNQGTVTRADAKAKANHKDAF